MSGGKKKRRDISKGLEQANAATQQAVGALTPYSQAGIAPTNQLTYLLGLGTPEQQQTATNAFQSSPFYAAGQNAFGLEKDAIDAGLANSGLLYSQARLNAVEDARQRNYSNAFSNYLNTTSGLAGIGLSGAGAIAGAYGQQGQNALNAGLATANTRQGFLGTLGQISQIGANIGAAASGFSDRRLKKNIKRIGYRNKMNFYRWEWNDEAKALGLSGVSSGFMADEVERVLPEAVGERMGFKIVDYGMIAERLG